MGFNERFTAWTRKKRTKKEAMKEEGGGEPALCLDLDFIEERVGDRKQIEENEHRRSHERHHHDQHGYALGGEETEEPREGCVEETLAGEKQGLLYVHCGGLKKPVDSPLKVYEDAAGFHFPEAAGCELQGPHGKEKAGKGERPACGNLPDDAGEEYHGQKPGGRARQGQKVNAGRFLPRFPEEEPQGAYFEEEDRRAEKYEEEGVEPLPRP
jgi:hypothetical protein